MYIYIYIYIYTYNKNLNSYIFRCFCTPQATGYVSLRYACIPINQPCDHRPAELFKLNELWYDYDVPTVPDILGTVINSI